MKILQVINSLGTGGAEKLLLETIPLYREAGIEMDILLLWDDQHPFTQQLKQLNICRVFVLNESSRVRDVYNPLNIFKMRRIMKDYPLVHVHLFPAQYFAVMANLFNYNRSRLIFTEHNTSNSRVKNQIFKPIERFVYSHYQYLVCITDAVKNVYRNYLTKSTKIVVINNGVDINGLANTPTPKRKDYGFSEKDQLLIMVAGFRHQKDQDTVIKALAELPIIYKLILVGDGVRRDALELLVSENNLNDRVFFLGLRTDVNFLYKLSDIAILSSHWEGFGLVAIEAMACGRPFIASDVPGLRDIVKDAGLLFPQGDAHALATIILQLAEDPALADKIAERGMERAMQYDIHKMTSQHIALYQSLYSTIKPS